MLTSQVKWVYNLEVDEVLKKRILSKLPDMKNSKGNHCYGRKERKVQESIKQQ